MKTTICFVFGFLLSIVAFAQSPSIWTNADGGDMMYAKGVLFDYDLSKVLIWGRGQDAACQFQNPAVLSYDSAGNFLNDTAYDIDYCAEELPYHAISKKNSSGLLIVSANEGVSAPDSSFIYSVDNNLSLQDTDYIGLSMTSDFIYYEGKYYGTSNNLFGVPAVWSKTETGGVVQLNTFNNSYMNNSFVTLVSGDGFIMEFASQAFNADTAFMCMVYDTVGNFVASYSYDADPVLQENLGHVSQINNNVFHVCKVSAGAKTYVGCSTVMGVVNWRDTIDHPYRAACTDLVSNVGYVLCLSGVDTYELFSYDLSSGNLIDSVEVDSSLMLSSIKSGPAGGVYLFYTKTFVNEVTLEQYESGLNLIWRGVTTHPFCSVTCTPTDFVIDSLGFAYTIDNCISCPQRTLIAKFGPSLVNVRNENAEMTFNVFPNPASDQFTINAATLPGAKRIRLTSISGQELFSDSFVSDTFTMNVELYASGIYILEVITDSGLSSTQKLIINR